MLEHCTHHAYKAVLSSGLESADLSNAPKFRRNAAGAVEFSLTPSERDLLGLVFRRGPQTQGGLADHTGLTQQSVSRLVAGLQQRGLVVVGDKAAAGRRGYPSSAAALNAEHARSAGLSIMADSVSLCICDFAGKVLAEASGRLPSMTVSQVMDWTEARLAELAGPDLSDLVGLGVGISGSFIGVRRGFNTPFSLNEWADRDIEALFAEQLGLPTQADNDGNVAALGESLLGVGRWAPSFAYLYIATGVGGGIVLNGEVWRGRHGNAGEFAGGLPTNVYPFPTLELLRQLTARQGLSFETVSELVANYDDTWPSIDDWLARVRDSFSIIASNASAILDLDAVVLGGLIPRALAERVIKVVELYDQKRRMVPRPVARLVPAEAPGDVTAFGAALMPLQRAFFASPARLRPGRAETEGVKV